MTKVSELAARQLTELADARTVAIKTIPTGVFNVQGYGTTLTGAAVQNALDAGSAEFPVGARVVLPPGVYVVNEPIKLKSGMSLVGYGGGYPRYGGYSGSNRNLSLPVVLVAGPDLPPGSPVIDARKCNNLGIYGLEIVGNGTSYGIAFGTFGQPNDRDTSGHYGNIFVEHCSFSNHKCGVAAKEATYQKYFRNNFGNNSDYGIYFQDMCGDSELVEQYINGTNHDAADMNRNFNVGLYLGISCGNSIVRGGKIEWNKVGMYINAMGIIISDVQFDDNAGAHVYFQATDIAMTATVTGCRFLGGGFRDVGGFTGAHIWVEALGLDARFPVNLTFTGNVFKSAQTGTPYEYGQEAVTKPVGPQRLAHIFGSGITRLLFSGNDIHQAANFTALYYYNHHPKSYVVLGDNAGDKITLLGDPPVSYGSIGGNRYGMGGLPTEGSWYFGDRVLSGSDHGYSSGYMCLGSGTYGTLPGVTGSIVSGSDQATLSDVSNLIVGDVLAFAGDGSRYIIRRMDYQGKVAYFDHAAGVSLAGAAVSHPVPDFRPFGQVSYRSLSGTPNSVLTPNFIGEEAMDSAVNKWYKATTMANTSWIQITP